MSEEAKPIRWYTVAEASDYLRVTPATLYNYMKSGRLPFYYLAGTRQRRIKQSDLDALFEPGNPADLVDTEAE